MLLQSLKLRYGCSFRIPIKFIGRNIPRESTYAILLRQSYDNNHNRFYSTSNVGENGGTDSNLKQSATAFASLVGLGALGYAFYKSQLKQTECKKQESSAKETAGKRRADLPNYRKADILAHKTKQTGMWVTFGHGVYDITEFQEGHPGGNKILLAAGGQLEPFWAMYAVHKNDEVYEILEGLRIGNIHPDDMKSMTVKSSDDPYSGDPERHPALRINSAKPFNAEPPVELLIDNFLTPNQLFFVRNHLPVPKIDAKKFHLEVYNVTSVRPLKLTLDELKKKFKVKKITAAVQCAGNRRSEMSKTKSVKGLSWGTAAISNAEWTGVKLSDVLEYLGVKEEECHHIVFQGLDKDLEGEPYEASIPIETAIDPRRDVLLAFEMNGEELPLDHGYPLRVVVPGAAGARQVKWVHKIIASKEESHSHWQRNDYKTFHPSINWDTVDFSKSEAIQDYPIQSAICEPREGDTIEDTEEVTVKGYAWSGGGRGIIRVDVSSDGGETWHEAQRHQAEQKLHRSWAWTLFEATIPIPKDHKGKLELICKAVDSSHNQQPESALGIWNLRGLIHNAWHRVEVNVPEDE